MNKNTKGLHLRSSVKTLSIKCYEEQMPKGWNEVKKRIKRQDKKKLQVLAIRHDKCIMGDNFWAPTEEKPHYHIIIRIVKRGKDNKVTPYKVETILKNLGIEYRKEEDKTLWENHGVETISNFANMAMYLTHDTEQAELDGKTKYDIKMIVSNLDIEEIKQIREGYTRPSEQNRKVSNTEMEKLCKYAKQLGKEFGDFESWQDELPYVVQKNTGMRIVRRNYDRGVSESIKELGTDILRLCIYIQGAPNEGKTYASEQALKDKRTILIKENGTGQFDEMTPTTEAIIVDDQRIPDLISMSDNRRIQVHRRCNGRPWWCGQYLVITSNKSFREWVSECGASQDYEAILSRFYVCHVEKIGDINMLYLDSESTRGTEDEKEKRGVMFDEFRDTFNYIVASYKKSTSATKSRRLGFGTIRKTEKDENGREIRCYTQTLMKGKIYKPDEPKQNTFSLEEKIEQKEKELEEMKEQYRDLQLDDEETLFK